MFKLFKKKNSIGNIQNNNELLSKTASLLIHAAKIDENYTNKEKYDCIITPSEFDSHFEHRIVSNFGWPLTRIKGISLIEYYSPSTLEKWIPNMFIDISDVYNTKLNMLKQFKSQQHRSYFSKETIDGFHTNFQCSKKGYNMIERFNLKQLFV